MTTDIQIEGDTLIVTRVYAAPIDEVFDAWIETSKIKQWWGCAECVNVESEVEPRLGGKYNHHMTIETEHGNHEAPGFATLVEFDPPNRLSYTSNDEEDSMVVTVSFEAVKGGTQVRLEHAKIPDIRVDGDVPLREIIRGGWTAATDKLERFLSPRAA